MSIFTRCFLAFLLLPLSAFAEPAKAGANDAALFADKPYELNLRLLQALDPKPIEISSTVLSDNAKTKSLRIISSGLPFPVVYEVISIESVTDPDNILKNTMNALQSHSDIILLEKRNNETLGNHLHYFQRVSVNDKPHHASSNYIFLRGSNFYHLSASNFAALVMGRKEWGEIKPDLNAEASVKFLLQSIQTK